MRISVIAPYFYPAHKAGGPVPGVMGVVSALVGNEVQVFTSDRDLGDTAPFPLPYQGTRKFEDAEVTYLASPSVKNIRHWAQAVRVILASDAVYINSLHSKLFAVLPMAVLAVRRFQGPVAISPRGELASSALLLGHSAQKRLWIEIVRRFRLDRTLGRSKNVGWLASSEGERADILKNFPKARVMISPEQLRRRPETEHEPRCPDEDTFRILSIGRIAPIKGTIDLVRALALVRSKVSVEFLGLAEDADYLAEVHAMAGGLPSNVQLLWAGPVVPELLQAKLLGAHLSVSLTHGENFGHAIGESLQAGCPVLISDQTPWSVVRKARAGRVLAIADCRKPEIVAANIDALASMSLEAWRDMSARSRKLGSEGLQSVGEFTLLNAFAEIREN